MQLPIIFTDDNSQDTLVKNYFANALIIVEEKNIIIYGGSANINQPLPFVALYIFRQDNHKLVWANSYDLNYNKNSSLQYTLPAKLTSVESMVLKQYLIFLNQSYSRNEFIFVLNNGQDNDKELYIGISKISMNTGSPLNSVILKSQNNQFRRQQIAINENLQIYVCIQDQSLGVHLLQIDASFQKILKQFIQSLIILQLGKANQQWIFAFKVDLLTFNDKFGVSVQMKTLENTPYVGLSYIDQQVAFTCIEMNDDITGSFIVGYIQFDIGNDLLKKTKGFSLIEEANNFKSAKCVTMRIQESTGRIQMFYAVKTTNGRDLVLNTRTHYKNESVSNGVTFVAGSYLLYNWEPNVIVKHIMYHKILGQDYVVGNILYQSQDNKYQSMALLWVNGNKGYCYANLDSSSFSAVYYTFTENTITSNNIKILIMEVYNNITSPFQTFDQSYELIIKDKQLINAQNFYNSTLQKLAAKPYQTGDINILHITNNLQPIYDCYLNEKCRIPIGNFTLPNCTDAILINLTIQHDSWSNNPQQLLPLFKKEDFKLNQDLYLEFIPTNSVLIGEYETNFSVYNEIDGVQFTQKLEFE
ncbi:UNKNOWN [Stylonychia lemnae]|uniref:Uncharacterized protein n=1 Tax=Stylonychia lemnae TaxID=5949 RepID=A0A078A765_STYLE|nr:UNKNOWN [Stylonychia lemnae]|eukprot:CDW78090.1 UNKNOWN [Stylonychia lemnae]